MARPVYAMLPILVAFSLLVQGSHCSRPLPAEERQPREVPSAPSPAAHRDDEPPYYPYRPDAAESGATPAAAAITGDDDGSRARADDDGAAPSSPRDEEQGGGGAVVSGHGRRSALLAGPPPPVPRRSKTSVRRVLPAGVVMEGGDSAARASCRSSDAHIGCAPPSEH